MEDVSDTGGKYQKLIYFGLVLICSMLPTEVTLFNSKFMTSSRDSEFLWE